MTKKRKYPVVLSIAGSDSSGGAGIQADLKTCCALGVYGMTAITAVTAQNTLGVIGIQDINPDMVYNQIKAVAEDIRPDAVKIGMLANASLVKTVSQALRDFELSSIVLDPVLVASSGSSLSGDKNETAQAMKEFLFPICDVVTPNIPEACSLLDIDEEFEDEKSLGIRLLALTGVKAVLIKGGHTLKTLCTDYLVERATDKKDLIISEFSAPRIESPNTHGTGCTLSSAIACGLAKGLTLKEAVEEGKKFVSEAMQHGIDVGLGNGTGPLDFLYRNPS